jgi:hypothetical protein
MVEAIQDDKKPVSELSNLKFVPTKAQRRLRAIRQTVVAGTIIAAVVGSDYLVVQSLLSGINDVVGYIPRILLMLIVTGFAMVVVFFVVSERSRVIRDGVLGLEFPFRRMGRGWTWEISLAEVVEVEFKDNPRGSFGVVLRLRDGPRIYLDQKGFGSRGLEILERICAAFGESYREGVKRPLLVGKHYGFTVARPSRLENETMVFAKAIRTSSRRKTKKIPIDQINTVERISTHYSGSGYLVWLADGTPFIIRGGDAVAVGLPNVPLWSSKVKDV